MVFNHNEKCDMLEAYILCRKNARNAQDYYAQTFPERVIPDRRYFLKLYRKFRQNTEIFNKKRTCKRFKISEETEIYVLAYFEAHPSNSIRDLRKESNYSLGTIHRILKKHKYVPFKCRPVQHLLVGDYQRRLNFCHWYLAACQENRNFFKKILWSDEANFSNKGMFNRKNEHFWSRENVFIARPQNPQHRFSLNVWCGMIGSRIVGPFFYRGSLTGPRYVEFMEIILQNFLDGLNLLERQSIYFQQDGAPAHNHHDVYELLNRRFRNNWIATNGPVQWPPRSPDITPLDFFLWGHVKDETYKQRYNTVEELQDRITAIITTIDGRTICKAVKSIQKRLTKCVEQQGNIFEHLL